MVDLDIIIPVYQSQNSIIHLIDALNEWISTCPLKVKVIFIEDYSGDGTFQTLKKELKNALFDNICIQLSKNYGQHTATSVGFHYSTAPLIATIDDDLQHPPIEISKLLDAMNASGANLIYGIYKNKEHHKIRNIGSSFLKMLMKIDDKTYNNVTSFRLIKSSVIQPFKDRLKTNAFIDESLIKNAGQIEHCTIQHDKRREGSSGYTSWRLIKTTLQILLFHSAWPLKLIIRFGLIMSIIFFSIGIYYIYQKIAYDVQLGFTSIIVAIFFSTGMIMLSLGIIAEYIGKIWTHQQKTDSVIIKEIC